ncbi:hypothetical protein GALL_508680 [mine drainage metagenome]|uniref:Uncharacterized protein n=1 Tax=mine drainage metagenome TaxID=410659 RepID=A0A1J5P9Y2_9ZZZZ
MLLPVTDTVGRAVVARRHRDGDAKRRRGLAGGVKRHHGLRGPLDFRGSPGDRDDARLVFGIVDGVGDRVDEARVGVGREVNDDARPRSDSARHLDVQHDLAVRAVGITRIVLASADRHGDHLGRLLPQRLEIGGDIGLAETTAELDEADGLAGCGHTLRELVKPSDLNRRESGTVRGVRTRKASSLRGFGRGHALSAKDPEVRPGLRTIVESEDGDDVALKFRGKIDAAVANAVGHALDRAVRQRDAERPLHICDGTGELDGPPSGRRRTGLDLEAKLPGKTFDKRHRGGVGRVVGVESRMGEALLAADMRRRQRVLAPDDDRHR